MTAPTDQEIAVAQALGRAAGREQRPVTICPYRRDQRVLRARWVMAYAEVGGVAGLLSIAAQAGQAIRRFFTD